MNACGGNCQRRACCEVKPNPIFSVTPMHVGAQTLSLFDGCKSGCQLSPGDRTNKCAIHRSRRTNPSSPDLSFRSVPIFKPASILLVVFPAGLRQPWNQ